MTNKLKIINDPVHGFIKIPFEILYDIIEHKYFQRLRRISQTGLLNLIFPGATHTRFHHAIGAMHLMFLALENLKHKGIEISEEEEKSALIAILLHDIGHGPFSHALENILVDNWHHEKLSLLLMLELNKEFSGEISLAIEMFQGKYHRKFFNQLITSQVDVDRLDYLKRDSFYTGVSEGNINANRLISMMNVYEDQLVIEEKGIYSVENFLTARMFMYWQVYFHKTASVAEFLLIKILKRAKELIKKGHPISAPSNLLYFLEKADFKFPNKIDIEKFTSLDDYDVLQAIKYWCFSDDFFLAYLCKSVIYRNLPKTKISSEPFSPEEINHKVNLCNKHFKNNLGEKLVDQIKRKLLPYSQNQQPIHILGKRDKLKFLNDSQAQILTNSLTEITQRYILAFPSEIS